MSTRKIEPGADLDTLINDLANLANESKEVCKRSLYDGAGVTWQAFETALANIPADERVFVYNGHRKHGITLQQKMDLMEAAGIAPMESHVNTVNTKIGVDGYNSVHTKKYPGGQPNILIARSVQAGTSYMDRYDFNGKARRQAKEPAIEKMKTAIRREVAERTKGG